MGDSMYIREGSSLITYSKYDKYLINVWTLFYIYKEIMSNKCGYLYIFSYYIVVSVLISRLLAACIVSRQE